MDWNCHLPAFRASQSRVQGCRNDEPIRQRVFGCTLPSGNISAHSHPWTRVPARARSPSPHGRPSPSCPPRPPSDEPNCLSFCPPSRRDRWITGRLHGASRSQRRGHRHPEFAVPWWTGWPQRTGGSCHLARGRGFPLRGALLLTQGNRRWILPGPVLDRRN
jgi:hypothetical protein